MKYVAMVAAVLLCGGPQEFQLSPAGRAIRLGAGGLWLECGIVNEEYVEFLLAANRRNVMVEVVNGLEPEEIRVWVPREQGWRPKMLVHLFPKMTLRVHCEEEARALQAAIDGLQWESDEWVREYPRCGDRAAVTSEAYGEDEFWISNSQSVIMYNSATDELYIDAFVESGKPESPTPAQQLGSEPVAARQPIVVRYGGVEVRAREGSESEDVTVRCAPVMTGTNQNQRRARRVVILLHCASEVGRWEMALENLRNGGGREDEFRSNIRTLNMRMLIGWCEPGQAK